MKNIRALGRQEDGVKPQLSILRLTSGGHGMQTVAMARPLRIEIPHGVYHVNAAGSSLNYQLSS